MHYDLSGTWLNSLIQEANMLPKLPQALNVGFKLPCISSLNSP